MDDYTDVCSALQSWDLIGLEGVLFHDSDLLERSGPVSRQSTPDVAVGSTEGPALRALERYAAGLTVGSAVGGRAPGAVGAVLSALLEDVSEPARARAVVLVLADAWTDWTVRRFARRRADPHRALRPSDSTGLETSELFRPYAAGTASWHGSTYLLATTSAVDAIGIAGAMSLSAPAVVLCEVAPVRADDFTDPGCLVTAARWPAVRHTGRALVGVPAADLPGDLLPALAALAGSQPATGAE